MSVTPIWEEFSAGEVAENIGATIERVIAERDAEIADLKANNKYLEARLAIEKAARLP